MMPAHTKHVCDMKTHGAHHQAAVIAIIEDDGDVNASLDDFLLSLGYQPAPFVRPETYLAWAREHECHCVISDIQVPGSMSGLDLISAAESLGMTTPMIMMSAHGDLLRIARSRSRHVFCCLPKPIDLRALMACITHALDPSRHETPPCP